MSKYYFNSEEDRIETKGDELDAITDYQLRFSAIDGDFSVKANGPIDALEKIDERVGLKSDGGVDKWGIVRFVGVEITTALGVPSGVGVAHLKQAVRDRYAL